MNLKKYAITLALFSAINANAEINMQCIDSTVKNCKIADEMNVQNEQIIVDTNQGRFYFCNGQWMSQDHKCFYTGNTRILNGELTTSDLVSLEASFSTVKKKFYCFKFFSTPACTEY